MLKDIDIHDDVECMKQVQYVGKVLLSAVCGSFFDILDDWEVISLVVIKIGLRSSS